MLLLKTLVVDDYLQVIKIKFTEVVGSLRRTYNFFSDKSSPERVIKEETKLSRILLGEHPYAIFTLVTGYPHYLPASRGAFGVGEIYRHVGGMLARAEDIARRMGENYIWPCPTCFEENDLPNLRNPCAQCEAVELKPRDVFETILDLDLFVVVRDDLSKVEQDIWDTAAKHGYHPSETDMRGTIISFPKTFPVDLNLVTEDEFYKALERYADPYADWVNQRVYPRIQWKGPETREWWFGMDMTMELRELMTREQGPIMALYDARRRFRENHTLPEVIQGLENAPKGRKRRLIQYPSVREAVAERYERIFNGRPYE